MVRKTKGELQRFAALRVQIYDIFPKNPNFRFGSLTFPGDGPPHRARRFRPESDGRSGSDGDDRQGGKRKNRQKFSKNEKILPKCLDEKKNNHTFATETLKEASK